MWGACSGRNDPNPAECTVVRDEALQATAMSGEGFRQGCSGADVGTGRLVLQTACPTRPLVKP
jgi:hypothetical protein